MMLILYLCITILLLVLLIHTHVHYSKFGRIINKIPGLPPFPILGNIYQTSFSTGKKIITKRKISKASDDFDLE